MNLLQCILKCLASPHQLKLEITDPSLVLAANVGETVGGDVPLSFERSNIPHFLGSKQ